MRDVQGTITSVICPGGRARELARKPQEENCELWFSHQCWNFPYVYQDEGALPSTGLWRLHLLCSHIYPWDRKTQARYPKTGPETREGKGEGILLLRAFLEPDCVPPHRASRSLQNPSVSRGNMWEGPKEGQEVPAMGSCALRYGALPWITKTRY